MNLKNANNLEIKSIIIKTDLIYRLEKLSLNQNILNLNLYYIKILENQLYKQENNKDIINKYICSMFTTFLDFLILNNPKSFFISRAKMISKTDFNFKNYTFEKPSIQHYKTKQSFCIEKNIKRCLYYLTLLKEVQLAIDSDVIIEKREIYYNNVKLFKNIDVVHRSIQEITFLLGIPRHMLNIQSSAIGLYSGKIQFEKYYTDNSHSCFLKKNDPVFPLIEKNMSTQTTQHLSINPYIQAFVPTQSLHFISPENQDKSQFNDLDIPISSGLIHQRLAPINFQASFLLVVEKETVYHHLLQHGFHYFFPRAIILTGKGYPDYLTKRFIQKIIKLKSNLACFYLGDLDPHGISILLDYLFGSEMSVYENLFCTVLHPLGVFNDDVVGMTGGIALDIEDINKIHQILGNKFFE